MTRAQLVEFATEEDLQDHAERLNQIGVDPDVPIIDGNGHALLASRTAPGGDGWGFAYYSPGEDGYQDCIHTDCADCGGRKRIGDWKPTFPVTAIVCYDLSGTEGLRGK
ncbi:hypothetical protein [Mycobacteroides chelonae]|uniref:Uncharacterized protein n=1 Tax=Mycobacteroides chelonae TaxID=1774 RepID=A0A1S1LXI5_MYCCH|nr:hypothetical protein [Mycobacteroides chelonae]OHU76061.1 hypothetical protein BKG84_24505 [Mycobacteroides chelonae]